MIYTQKNGSNISIRFCMFCISISHGSEWLQKFYNLTTSVAEPADSIALWQMFYREFPSYMKEIAIALLPIILWCYTRC